MTKNEADAAALLKNREWRMDNLYRIQDVAGAEVRFVRNEPQRAFWETMWFLNALLKGRQLGFSTLTELLILDTCFFRKNTTAGIVDLTLDDAKKKLAKIRYAYERMPLPIRGLVPLLKDNEAELVFANGSSVRASTSHIGATLQILHVSEYGLISSNHPDRARAIRRGSFGTVHAGQQIFVESTAEGMAGEFHEICENAQNHAKEGRQLTAIDFKFHFFAWWRMPSYRLPSNLVTVPAELHEYFEKLKSEHGINLDADQCAWYVRKQEQVGPDDMKSQYPSFPDEAWGKSLEGAYFKREMAKARADGRIGQRVPFDPSRKVNTFWDIGRDDPTSVWFHQSDGVRHRLIDFFEADGESLQFFVKEVKKRGDERGYVWGKHYGPHDIEVTDWSSNNQSRKKIAADLGLEFKTVPRVQDKGDSIEAARRFLNLCWFDSVNCKRGVDCLDNYRREWNEKFAVWRSEPKHDWASHGADSFQTGVLGFIPDAVPRESRTRGTKREGLSQWSA